MNINLRNLNNLVSSPQAYITNVEDTRKSNVQYAYVLFTFWVCHSRSFQGLQ